MAMTIKMSFWQRRVYIPALAILTAALASAVVYGQDAPNQTYPPITICIDPGHPSEVGRGTAGRHVSEMHVAWIEANDVKKLLEAQGITVVMTKSSEPQFVTNIDRATIANNAHASLLVRLHCDGGAPGSGYAVYFPDRQGVAHGVKGPSANVLASSKIAAESFHSAMAKELSGEFPDRGLHPDTATRVGGKQGALTGSVFAKEPVLLVEMCVLTNPKDESWIMSATGEHAMAKALANAAIEAVEVSRTGNK